MNRRDTYRKFQKRWARFEEWQRHQRASRSAESAFLTIGEWVDFFLSKHRKYPRSFDVQGIRLMHKRLSRLSLTE